MKRFLITGGAGFIGSALVRYLLTETDNDVMVIDKLSYAGSMTSLAPIASHPGFTFKPIDICDRTALQNVVSKYQPDIIMHLAAESHVDRSVDAPHAFVETNIVGTYQLLEAARYYWLTLKGEKKRRFIFHHISTDEVFGELLGSQAKFSENSPYAPGNPYSASKASSDHLVRAWQRTFGLPAIVTNCSNNYGPYHFPEKLIPLMIINAMTGKLLPVYGDGTHIRDWLYVDDHVRALYQVVTRGRVGETYNIGGNTQCANIDVVEMLCVLLEELATDKPSGVIFYRDLITFVEDRPGHDVRYAIDTSKIQRELGWRPQETFASGLRKTVRWFLQNKSWWQKMVNSR